MAIRASVRAGLSLRASVSSNGLRIVAPAFRKASVAVSNATYKALPSYALLHTAVNFQDIHSSIYFRSLIPASVVLDPDTNNRYIRDDSVSFVDQLSMATEKSVFDVANATDFATLATTKLLSDGLTIGDSAVVTLEIIRNFSDQFTIGDSSFFTFGKGVAEVVSLGEALAFDTSKAVTDIVTATDLLGISFTRPVSDGVTVADTPIITVDYNRAAFDYAYLADESVLSVGKNVEDAVAPTDATATTVGKSLADVLATDDATAIHIGRIETDSVSAADSLARTVSYNRVFSDAVAIDDNATVGGVEKETQASKTNIIAVLEEHTYTLSKSVFDSLAATDVADKAILKSLSDTIGITESLVIQTIASASSVLNASALNVTAFNS